MTIRPCISHTSRCTLDTRGAARLCSAARARDKPAPQDRLVGRPAARAV